MFSDLVVDEKEAISYRVTRDGKRRLVLPLHKREMALSIYHDHPSSGHRGVTSTYEKIREHLWWPKMKEDVSYWCGSCEQCARFKNPSTSKAPLQSLTSGNPFEVVAIDFIGPMTTPTKEGNLYLLVMVDYFTRYAEAVPLPDRRATTVAKAIYGEWICQAQEFKSDLIAELCTLLRIKKQGRRLFIPKITLFANV